MSGNGSRIALPLVIGHRGAAAVAPENTLAGLRAAKAAGVTWVEFDVMLTDDDVPVLFHDDSLKRVTGREQPMAETAYAALSALEAGTWFSSAFAGEPVPTLEQALALLVELRLRPNIELKPTPGRGRATAERTLAVLAERWPAGYAQPLISSFDRMALAAVQELAPALPRGLLAVELPADWRAAAVAFGCVSLHLQAKKLTRGQT
ncbi:MAG: glycerophosphodiester phosphodiesterase family protein, partial [Geminicoccales bacterium]